MRGIKFIFITKEFILTIILLLKLKPVIAILHWEIANKIFQELNHFMCVKNGDYVIY